MLNQGLEKFSGQRVLLLQGPVGPFFARLADDLRRVGAQVFKVNFNAGDWLFYPREACNFRGTMSDWPAALDRLLALHDIDVIMLYGDCRPVHQVAVTVARQRGLLVKVFEEGYIRPDYITLEPWGVNGNSTFFKTREFLKSKVPPRARPPDCKVGNTYPYLSVYGLLYFAAGALGWLLFPGRVHHRPLSVRESVAWLRSLYRKFFYAHQEKDMLAQLVGAQSKKYFLVPLQVFNDAQVRFHSDFASVADFITTVVTSFARQAPQDVWLVFKHHPMDRGYVDYTALIEGLAREHGLVGRLHYIHDQHLPTLLDHARGAVVINSTVGLSALWHRVPTVVCGRCIYDVRGLTYQEGLDTFWRDAGRFMVDYGAFRKFQAYLIRKTQVNGSFYKRLPGLPYRSGVAWPQGPEPVSQPPQP